MEPKSNKAVIQAGWAHAPWLSKDIQEKMFKDTPINLREARKNGTPSIGSGNVYPIPLEEILVEDFPIEKMNYWRRMFAFDVGWNRTAGLWATYNPDTDVIYLYSEHYQGLTEPHQHAEAIRGRDRASGFQIPGVIDPASRSTNYDGKSLIRIYNKEYGLKLREADNALESGVYAVMERLSSGRLKVFRSLINFQEEYVLYRRDMHGRIHDEDDHLMDCMRYVVLNLRYAKARPLGKTLGGGVNGGAGGREYFKRT